MLFALLTWQEAVRGRLLAWDEPVRSAIAGASVRPEHRWPVAHVLADLGDARAAVPMLAVALAYAVWRGRRAGARRWWLPPVAYALAMAAVPLLVEPLKGAIGRSGPGSLKLAPGYPGLYPSGHTATAVLAFGAAVLLVVPYVRRAVVRRLLAVAVALLNLAVGVALVVLRLPLAAGRDRQLVPVRALPAGAAAAVRSGSGSRG